MTRILVTGVTGFHGYHVSSWLASLGYDVYGLVRFGSQHKKVPDNVKIVVGDITDAHSMISIMGEVKPEVVIHLAAMTPVAMSFDQPDVYAHVNYVGTINVAEAWRKKVPKQDRLLFIYASTSECYGQQDRFPIPPDAPLKPNTPYAVSKLAGELYLRCYLCEEIGENVVVSVPFNSYGRAFVGQRWFVVERILSHLAEGRTVVELGDPAPIRDFVFREDVVRAYISLVSKGLTDIDAVRCKRFNFATGRGVTIAELVDVVKRVTGIDFEVRWNRVTRPADIRILIGDWYLSYRYLGWKPMYSLEDGISIAFKEWRQVLGT